MWEIRPFYGSEAGRAQPSSWIYSPRTLASPDGKRQRAKFSLFSPVDERAEVRLSTRSPVAGSPSGKARLCKSRIRGFDSHPRLSDEHFSVGSKLLQAMLPACHLLFSGPSFTPRLQTAFLQLSFLKPAEFSGSSLKPRKSFKFESNVRSQVLLEIPPACLVGPASVNYRNTFTGNAARHSFCLSLAPS